MLDHRKNEIVIVENLKASISTTTRPCEVVRQNQTAKVPLYPYVSYTVTSSVSAMSGTYSEAKDGTLYRNITQTWSFTVQSDDQEEALAVAMKIYDFFTATGRTILADNGIAVRRVRDITTRDNLLSVQYEYRNGLDVTFGFLYTITPDEHPEVIESNTFKEESVCRMM